MKSKPIKLYKFLNRGMKSEYGNKKYRIGQWYKTSRPLEMCGWGFHGSKRIIDAFGYVQGSILCEIEVRGKSIKEDDKQCWSEMKIRRAWKWKKRDSVALAIFAAEQVIDLFEKEYPKDKRPREAIEAARKWLKNPSRDAAWDAWDAAWDAARDAAWDAWDAARAAWDARDAAWDAAWDAEATIFNRIEKWMRGHIKELGGEK